MTGLEMSAYLARGVGDAAPCKPHRTFYDMMKIPPDLPSGGILLRLHFGDYLDLAQNVLWQGLDGDAASGGL